MKKGISPLIATVIILGMVVTIGAMIMLFGKSFVEKTTQKVDVESDEKTICMKDVNFEIISVCYVSTSPPVIKVVMLNTGNKDINKLYARFYKSQNEVFEGQRKATLKLSGSGSVEFGVESADIKQVDVFPMIRHNFKSITCAGNVASYGDYFGTSFRTCAS